MKQSFLLLILALVFTTCFQQKGQPIERIVHDYYEIYNQRQDLNRFLEFYDDSIILEDIINGDRIEGKAALKNFLDWGNTDFKLLDSNSLSVSETIIQGNQAVIKGYFTGFQWGEAKFGPMHFTTILTFNESEKIIKQVDWINYPANLVDYTKRKNSNDWIK